MFVIDKTGDLEQHETQFCPQSTDLWLIAIDIGQLSKKHAIKLNILIGKFIKINKQ